MSEEQVMSIEATSDRAALLRQMADQMDRDCYGHGYAAAALREYAALITADLSEAQQAQAPGWQLVPVEPTIQMLMAGGMPRLSLEHPTIHHAVWAAMLKAAPQQGSKS